MDKESSDKASSVRVKYSVDIGTCEATEDEAVYF